jgi:aldehyde dehydrogenase (NAD+)
MCARRLLLGKCTNAGQTCVAPDYVLVPKDFQDTLVQALKDACVVLLPLSPRFPQQFGIIFIDIRNSIPIPTHLRPRELLVD